MAQKPYKQSHNIVTRAIVLKSYWGTIPSRYIETSLTSKCLKLIAYVSAVIY